MSIRDYQVAALDRSSLMTAIGHRVTLIKGGSDANGAVFFPFRTFVGSRASGKKTGPE